MESPDEDDDLKLVKASAGLLSDLESALPKLLWKPSKDGSHGRVHTQTWRRDLDYVIRLIESFQGEPQLLDARLKNLLPPIVEAYLDYLRLKPRHSLTENVDFQSAICMILYTLCKVRGYKVIQGFLSNEPRYLEPILSRLEDVINVEKDQVVDWQVQYVLLLWLSHLLLTPFDLASISDRPAPQATQGSFQLPSDLPSIAYRLLQIGLLSLAASTKAQEAAAMLLVRLVKRPDMQKLNLADCLVAGSCRMLQDQTSSAVVTIYDQLGPLRFLAGIASSAELGHLVPSIYRTCESLSARSGSPASSNAVVKKLMVKIFRNIAILSLHSTHAQGSLLSFLETTNVLEEVVDHLLNSLGDRDTPVRYASAKALSLIILDLEPSMGHEVIQAMLDMLKEDMPRHGEGLDFRSVNALKWHGLTLALAHTLFKRSASPDQLPDIVNALVSALQFEQRTATGSSLGTNVRDAANFGIWSLSRRYTTKELFDVDASTLTTTIGIGMRISVIQGLAIQLILSACLDPAGNIRRGSSAALQELVGRHPNQVVEGIALVQIVDYQAVGLRRRAMVDVVDRAAKLHQPYWTALVDALLGWRGLGSADVPAREAMAASLSSLSNLSFNDSKHVVLEKVLTRFHQVRSSDLEDLHGLALSLACLLGNSTSVEGHEHAALNGDHSFPPTSDCWTTLDIIQTATKDFSPRLLRSELPAATAQMLTALTRSQLMTGDKNTSDIPFAIVDTLTERLLVRHEETIQQVVPALVQSLLALKRGVGMPLGFLGAQSLCKKVGIDGSKSTLNGTCGAIALGALAPYYDNGLSGEKAKTAVVSICRLIGAMNVDWRVIGVRAIQLAIEAGCGNGTIERTIAQDIVEAIHLALNDHTIDERGDVGSLVRLSGIACTSRVFEIKSFATDTELLSVLQADMYRLSLEKLDRVRLAAAQCRHQLLNLNTAVDDVANVASYRYFSDTLRPLVSDAPAWLHKALLEGCISCAGSSAEPLLQASRAAVMDLLNTINENGLKGVLLIYSNILKTMLLENGNMHPALELLAFLLDMQIPQRLAESDFKWRNLLSTVQKSHHKSNDIPKILAAVQVYRGLVDIPVIRDEVMKKLVSMLRTVPYPRVKVSVAETLVVITRDESLKAQDWTRPASQHTEAIAELQKRYLTT